MLRKNIFTLCIFMVCLLFGTNAYSQEDSDSDNGEEKIAVISFETKGDLNVTDGGQIVADWLLTAIGKTKEYTIVERDRLEDILAEYELSYSGMIDEDTAVEIGKISGVSMIVVGTISKFVNTITVSARMIDTETGYVESVGDIKAEDLDAVYDTIPELAEQLLSGTGASESIEVTIESEEEPSDQELELPDTVTPDDTEYVYHLRPASYTFFGVGVLSAAGGLAFDILAKSSAEVYNNAYSSYLTANGDFDNLWSDVENTYQTYTQQKTLRNVFYITAGVSICTGVVTLFIKKPANNKNFAYTIMPTYAAFHWQF